MKRIGILTGKQQEIAVFLRLKFGRISVLIQAVGVIYCDLDSFRITDKMDRRALLRISRCFKLRLSLIFEKYYIIRFFFYLFKDDIPVGCSRFVD